MKALSIIEPYASLIAYGLKRIETRSWATKYRGPILIHASATRIPKEYRDNPDLAFAKGLEMHNGYIVCKANLVDCVLMTEEFLATVDETEKKLGFYSVGRYAWILEDVEPVEMVKAKGHLGIWNYEKEGDYNMNFDFHWYLSKENGIIL